MKAQQEAGLESMSKKEQLMFARELEKLEKDIGGLEGRLNNPRFVANAADEVVEEARGQLAEKADEAARLREVLAKLSAMV